MAKCKVCGKEFTPCRTNTPLNWRRVACCAEHGAVWFDMIEKARNVIEVAPSENVELQTLLAVEEPETTSIPAEDEKEEDVVPACVDVLVDESEDILENPKGRKHK